jgi:probable F420-dependent oxidoreductase
VVEFGVSLPTIGMDDPSAIRLVAEQAEASGLDSVWAADHIVLPVNHTSTYPYSDDGEFLIAPGMPFLDQFTTLSYVAGFTTHLKLGTAVTLLPLRHPLAVAKTVSTLDVLSKGRAILGVAAGWLREEFEALGQDFDNRGRILDEGIDVLRAAWTETTPNFKGRFFEIHGIESYPQPTQKPHPPIWVGGHTTPVMKRAARSGSAWFPPLFNTTPRELAASHSRINEEAASLGRGDRPVSLSLRVLVDLRSEPDLAGATKRGALVGNPERVASELAPYLEIGVSHLVFLPQARNVADVQRTIDLLASQVVPQLRTGSNR